MLPYDMLMVILTKVGAFSSVDLWSCMVSCKTFLEVAKYPEVLRSLRLEDVFLPPYERVPNGMDLLKECAKSGNVHGIFLCGLFNFFYLKSVKEGLKQLATAAKEAHSEAMYLYGMISLIEGVFDEGSNYLTQLWRNQGIESVRQCQMNVRRVVLEMSVRQYREYDILLNLMEIGEECGHINLNEVCDEYFIRKEIYRFMDYMN
ncbi:unnamed protein product [Thlaspi arvense]|uniref:At2g35280-like TPR domain-containing protein n=1 Tax=Thlaspi arvense TaxID=13288 RepID=A0AAU9T625_THLAR|nr:unnamed protein product [Thlaspi arvense]